MEIVLLSAAVEGSPLYQLAKRVVNVDHGLRCAAPIGGVVEDGHQPVAIIPRVIGDVGIARTERPARVVVLVAVDEIAFGVIFVRERAVVGEAVVRADGERSCAVHVAVAVAVIFVSFVVGAAGPIGPRDLSAVIVPKAGVFAVVPRWAGSRRL